mgnify:CR=1 FL=1
MPQKVELISRQCGQITKIIEGELKKRKIDYQLKELGLSKDFREPTLIVRPLLFYGVRSIYSRFFGPLDRGETIVGITLAKPNNP